ncbi:MAG: hypothetical protein KAR38_13880 [Calditrichia bacterium]|nr:hypothetical protein [Calditrichia bacterium]
MFYYLGLSYTKVKLLEKAVSVFNKAVKTEKNALSKARYNYELGQVYIKLKQYSKAEQALLAGLKTQKRLF